VEKNSEWLKGGTYYDTNGDWTICKTGIKQVKFGLWKGSKNYGWFDTNREAIAKWKELTA
jgi:hypothetical protein